MKSFTLRLLFAVALVAGGASIANAKGGSGWGLNLPFFYNSTEVCVNGTCGDGAGVWYDFKFGHTMSSGLYLGVIYSDRTSDSGATTTGWTSYGATVGFEGNSGWFVHASYLLSAEYDTGAAVQSESPSGMQADFGFNHFFNSNFGIGPQLTYVTLQSDNEAESNERKETHMYPQINLAIRF